MEQAPSRPKHGKTRTQMRAHRPRSYELQDYLFMHLVEENYTISNGMIEVNEKLSNMTVHVRTISGKTISIKCDKRQSIPEPRMKLRRGQRSRKPFSIS